MDRPNHIVRLLIDDMRKRIEQMSDCQWRFNAKVVRVDRWFWYGSDRITAELVRKDTGDSVSVNIYSAGSRPFVDIVKEVNYALLYQIGLIAPESMA